MEGHFPDHQGGRGQVPFVPALRSIRSRLAAGKVPRCLAPGSRRTLPRREGLGHWPSTVPPPGRPVHRGERRDK